MGNRLDAIINFCPTDACRQEVDIEDIQKGRDRRNRRKLSKIRLQSTPQSIHLQKSQSQPQIDLGAFKLDSLLSIPAVSTEQSYLLTPEQSYILTPEQSRNDSDYSSDVSELDPSHHHQMVQRVQRLRSQSHSHLIRMRSRGNWDPDDYDDLELEMKVEVRRLSLATPIPDGNNHIIPGTDEDGIDLALDLDYTHVFPSIHTPSEPGARQIPRSG